MSYDGERLCWVVGGNGEVLEREVGKLSLGGGI